MSAGRRRGSFRESVRGLLEDDPDRYAHKLLESGASGIKLATELLEAEERRETESDTGFPVDATGRPLTGLVDVLHLAYTLPGAALALGLPALDSSQLAELEAARDRRREERGGLEP